MNYIKIFDPWKNPLCTCPLKYSLNPYTGCSFSCLYCYISSFIKDPFIVREKRDIIEKVKKDIEKIDKNLYVSLSNSSDPYPYIEEKLKITREILKIFKDKKVGTLIITKSDLILRDVDLLREMKVSVSMTITTFKEIYKIIEPFAPSPERRLNVLKKLKESGIKTSVRIDPIIPYVNDNIDEIENMIKIIKNFSDQIIVSTLKLRGDSIKRFKEKLPKVYEKFIPLYKEKFRGNLYLDKNYRYKIIFDIYNLTKKYNLYFSSCREGFVELNTNICDGSGLIKNIV
ncbi:MAG: SPL family radical SAM protein [Caldisericia bacterium]